MSDGVAATSNRQGGFTDHTILYIIHNHQRINTIVEQNQMYRQNNKMNGKLLELLNNNNIRGNHQHAFYSVDKYQFYKIPSTLFIHPYQQF